jgi:hypothetical protein
MGKSEDKSPKAAQDHAEEDPSANWDSPPPYELHSTGGVLASSAAVNGKQLSCRRLTSMPLAHTQTIADASIS